MVRVVLAEPMPLVVLAPVVAVPDVPVLAEPSADELGVVPVPDSALVLEEPGVAAPVVEPVFQLFVPDDAP